MVSAIINMTSRWQDIYYSHTHLNISESPTCFMHLGMSAVQKLHGQCEVPGAERGAEPVIDNGEESGVGGAVVLR